MAETDLTMKSSMDSVCTKWTNTIRRSVAIILIAVAALGLFDSHGNAALQPVSQSEQFAPGAIWLDNNGVAINAHGGGVLLFRHTYYWFGEHKIAGRAGNAAHVGVHVYSSRNLYDWIDRGIALKVSSDPSSEICDGCIIERPKVIYNRPTRKFVMWFHLELQGHGYSSARTGVAVASTPTGPYTYLGSFRPDAGILPINAVKGSSLPDTEQRDFDGGQMSRDMNIFVDDDGNAYQIFSSEDNAVMDISKLSDDYLKPSGVFARAVLPMIYREAPAMFKCHGKYYLITSATTGWAPNAADVSVADSIWGPYKSLGNPCVGEPQEISTTFNSQSTFVLPLKTKSGNAFIYIGDRWNPKNAIDGRYVWLPLMVVDGMPQITWHDRWNLKNLR